MSESAAHTPTIMVVEDEPDIANAIVARLHAEGYKTHIAHDGLQAVQDAKTIAPDMMILDLMLPGLDGLEVCRQVHQDNPIPVIMVTARDEETDKIIGLGVGADDYLTKPFSPRELAARVRAIFRRIERTRLTATSPNTQVFTWGQIRLDTAQRKVTVNDKEISLTPTEFDLLNCFLSEPQTVWTRERLLADVWDWHDAAGTRTVDSHVKGLRRKVGTEWIRTVHGVGYALDEPSQQPSNTDQSSSR